jgi:hypothetical protein
MPLLGTVCDRSQRLPYQRHFVGIRSGQYQSLKLLSRILPQSRRKERRINSVRLEELLLA